MSSHPYSHRYGSSSARWAIDPALIVILMFTTVSAFLTQPFWNFEGFKEASAPASLPASPPVLRVASDRSITIEGETVSIEEVPGRIETVLSGREARLISFEADARTHYGYATRVIEQVRRGGGDPRLSTNLRAEDSKTPG